MGFVYSWVCMMHSETLWIFQSCHQHCPKAVFFLSSSFTNTQAEDLEPRSTSHSVSCQALPFGHLSVDCLVLLMTLALYS